MPSSTDDERDAFFWKIDGKMPAKIANFLTGRALVRGP
jgi:hypothetical protein